MKKIFVLFLLFLSIHTYSQDWTFEYNLGYGLYQLDDMKTLQHSMQNNYGLIVTDDFPGYINHTLNVGYAAGRHNFGGTFSYLTSGGRLHRADYSGSYTIDMIMNGYKIGAFYRYNIPVENSPVSVYLQVSPGVVFSDLTMEEDVNIYTENANENTKLKSTGIYIEPAIGAVYHYKKWLNFTLRAGYESNFKGELKYEDQNTGIDAKWNGLRFYGGLIFILPNSKQSSNE
nr:hypothetical protein [uncultured Carboxylicivirga sp.]